MNLGGTMMRSLHNQNQQNPTHDFVDALEVGTRVVWIANGAEGTVQPDKSIFWDDGYHMTRERMQAGDLLLIRNPRNRKRVAITSKAESQTVVGTRRRAHGSSPADATASPAEALQATPLRKLRPLASTDSPTPFN